jgi:hypothetical protein
MQQHNQNEVVVHSAHLHTLAPQMEVANSVAWMFFVKKKKKGDGQQQQQRAACSVCERERVSVALDDHALRACTTRRPAVAHCC